MKKRILRMIFSLFIVAACLIAPVAPCEGQNSTISNGEELEIILAEDINLQTEETEETIQLDERVQAMHEDIRVLNSTADTKEWFVQYKYIISEYKDKLGVHETIYDKFTSEELDRFFRVVQAEIGDEYTFEQKCNVASVILNRINHYRFSDSMCDILTSDQFETIRNGSYKRVDVSEDTILACEYVYMMGDTTGGALFFDSNSALNYKFMFNDGAHNFYKLYKE